MGPHGGLSGVATPDLGWQQSGRRGRAAAARVSTSAETSADTQASPRHGSPTVVSTSSAQSGLPTPTQYDPYTEPEPPNLQEQMTEQREQLTALTVQIAALAAALMAGQRDSAAEVCTPSPRPSPPWTATTLPAAPAAPPAPPAPAPPPPPTPAAPPPPTPAAQPTPTPPAAEPLYELSAPDFCAAMGHEHRFPAIKSLTATITKALKVNLDPITMDTELEALLNLLRTHDTNMPFYLDCRQRCAPRCWPRGVLGVGTGVLKQNSNAQTETSIFFLNG